MTYTLPEEYQVGYSQLILDRCKEENLLRNQAAYVLATAKWETGHTFKPVRETKANTDDRAIEILDRAWKSGRLSWVRTPYWRKDNKGKSWLGRGFVQLTWKRNYKKAGEKLGVDLLSDPNKALDPDIAASILVVGMKEGWFTGKRLDRYVTLQTSNFLAARRVVNGNDRASKIAAIARTYDRVLKDIKYD